MGLNGQQSGDKPDEDAHANIAMPAEVARGLHWVERAVTEGGVSHLAEVG